MFRSLFNLAGDVLKVAAAPVTIAAELARTITKPVADTAEEVAKTITDVLKDDVK